MTKIFLSSLDVNIDDLSDQAIYQSKYLLVTFFYGRKVIKNPRFLEALKYFNEKDHLILDSGAFSFMNGQKASEEEMDEYCREYVKFINKYHIKHFVELDVDALFGYHKALEYRKYIEEQTERQCIPIFHKSRGKKAFMKMCDEYKYAGIGGIAIKNIKKMSTGTLNSLIVMLGFTAAGFTLWDLLLQRALTLMGSILLTRVPGIQARGLERFINSKILLLRLYLIQKGTD